MTVNMTVTKDPAIESRYERAQTLMQGAWTKSIAFNTTAVPHWINQSGFFWYEREFKNGKEFRLVDANAGTNETAFNHTALASALAKASGEAGGCWRSTNQENPNNLCAFANFFFSF